jgi:hypothetical protein
MAAAVIPNGSTIIKARVWRQRERERNVVIQPSAGARASMRNVHCSSRGKFYSYDAARPVPRSTGKLERSRVIAAQLANGFWQVLLQGWF